MERLGESARRVLAASGVPEAGPLTAIVREWPAVVGDSIARNAWPSRLARDGTLHVATVSSTWAFELGRLGPDIADRLQATLGDDAPASLRFAPGPVPEPPAPLTPPGPVDAPRPAPEDMRVALELTAGIGDEELRALIARAAAASLSRARSGRGFW